MKRKIELAVLIVILMFMVGTLWVDLEQTRRIQELEVKLKEPELNLYGLPYKGVKSKPVKR